jgi:SAM-dependent methyltransferase
MPCCGSITRRRFTRQMVGSLVMATLLSIGLPALGQSARVGYPSSPLLRTAQILDLAKYLAATNGPPDAYNRLVKAAFDAPPGLESKVTAYEENRSFVYAVAEMQAHFPPTGDVAGAPDTCRWLRRVIILDSSTFIIEDELRTSRPVGFNIVGLLSTAVPTISGRTAHIADASGELSAEILFPRKAAYQINGRESEGSILGTTPWGNAPGARSIQILCVGAGPSASGQSQSEMTMADGKWSSTIKVGNKLFKLALPPPTAGAGEISIASLDGKTLVANRPFPSGILPHGPEGNRLLELWDSDYRKPEPAYWDIGRPADELQKTVSGGTVARCRVVDMCCGSGTDAIYLASKGFDVTAIDVAPTALGQAMEKAANAKVSVHWVVADILAPPDVKPFDFVYDRGCYHVVRDQNLNAYTETLRRFSHPGTKFLLLASRRNDMFEGGHSGVTEEELRFDFLALFDLQWLREIKLESNKQGEGPPGWSAFLIRNSAP